MKSRAGKEEIPGASDAMIMAYCAAQRKQIVQCNMELCPVHQRLRN